MRVITRHSKLLYFRKHLPRWQFLALSWIITAEAELKGRSSWVLGHDAERRAWGTIRDVARRMRAGADLKGAEVLKLAEAVEVRQAVGHRGERDPSPAWRVRAVQRNHEPSAARLECAMHRPTD